MTTTELEGSRGASEPRRSVGVVVIGRDEGERLVRSIDSLGEYCSTTVYVDSGSTDDSVDVARTRGCDIVELDPTRPFTAARARNEGFARLPEEIEYVQFVDGDTALEPGWIESAAAALDERDDVAVVWGSLRERDATRSVYKRLCNLEWQRENADSRMFGIFMVRSSAFREVEGFDPTVAAGEEPELALRLEAKDWALRYLSAPMGIHDVGDMSFGSWWRRTMRSGAAFLRAAVEGGDRHARRAIGRIVFWTVGIAALAALTALLLGPWGWLGLLAYPAQIARLAARRHRRCGTSWGESWLFGAACVFGKWPELLGAIGQSMRLSTRKRAPEPMMEAPPVPSCDETR